MDNYAHGRLARIKQGPLHYSFSLPQPSGLVSHKLRTHSTIRVCVCKVCFSCIITVVLPEGTECAFVGYPYATDTYEARYLGILSALQSCMCKQVSYTHTSFAQGKNMLQYPQDREVFTLAGLLLSCLGTATYVHCIAIVLVSHQQEAHTHNC